MFEVAGHKYPKNLVEIDGEPLVQRVIDGLRPTIDVASRAIFLIREEEQRRHHTGDVIRLLVAQAEVVGVPAARESGAACTALHAIGHIDRDESLLVFNGDQVVEADLAGIVAGFEAAGLDAGTITFDAVHPRWSYVRTGADGLVVEAAEKRPISRLATAGAYWFRRGGDFIDGVMSMIRKDASVDGAFYVCPVFNELVLRGRRIGTHHIERDRYFSLASLHGVDAYEQHLARLRQEVPAMTLHHKLGRDGPRLVRRRLRADRVAQLRGRGRDQALRRRRRRGAARPQGRHRADRRRLRPVRMDGRRAAPRRHRSRSTPGEPSDFLALTDAAVVAVKLPAVRRATSTVRDDGNPRC